MDFPTLSGTTDAEAASYVAALVRDAERQLVTACYNRVLNPGPGGESFDAQALSIRAGLAAIRSNPTWARYLPGAAEGVALPAPLSLVAL